MQPHQQRVVDERAELADKAVKLAGFLTGAIFASLPQEERARLGKQLYIMRDYLDILDERIKAF